MICDDKWLNYSAMFRAGLRQPRTAILTHEENLDIFRTVRRLFDLENPHEAPVFTSFKTQVKREL